MRLTHGARNSANGSGSSVAFPNPVPLGIPSSLIDSFQIPPFLLPIYQAAGIEYDVPWQVLAAINWIETDYGRDLAVSSAGAVGWMQFLPSTWKRYGVDATGSGYADPYNPTDAIFGAARYLAAAGATTNLSRAIFAYNHAGWYVASVLLRAQLIGGMPQTVLGALTELVQGHFPVAARAWYRDSGGARTTIYSRGRAPVVAVSDGKVVAIGDSPTLGRYVELQDATGNTYTYAHLGSIPALYPVPKPLRITAAQVEREILVPDMRPARAGAAVAGAAAPKPSASEPATSGTSSVAANASSTSSTAATTSSTSTIGSASSSLGSAGSGATTRSPAATGAGNGSTTLVKERLFANPARPASYAAGGAQQLNGVANVRNYFSDVLHLTRNQYTLEPLQVGSIVVAGTIIGHLARAVHRDAATLQFMIQPAGRGAPYIDPKPILDGWRLLQATAIYRANGLNAFLPGSKTATIGQILLESKQQLQARVLRDRHVKLDACGRRGVAAGLVDQRILATMEFLSDSGLYPTVSGLPCSGAGSADMSITALNGISVAGHQGSGSITDIAIRRLLTLQGSLAPTRIVSLRSYPGEANTLALPDHANRIEVTYASAYGRNRKAAAAVADYIAPRQWLRLIKRLGQIPEPSVPTGRSSYAIKTG